MWKWSWILPKVSFKGKISLRLHAGNYSKLSVNYSNYSKSSANYSNYFCDLYLLLFGSYIFISHKIKKDIKHRNIKLCFVESVIEKFKRFTRFELTMYLLCRFFSKYAKYFKWFSLNVWEILSLVIWKKVHSVKHCFFELWNIWFLHNLQYF